MGEVVGWARWYYGRGGGMCEVVGWTRWYDGRGGGMGEVVGWARWWDVRGGTMCEVVGWARWWDVRGAYDVRGGGMGEVVGWARWWDGRGGGMCEVVRCARWWDGRGGGMGEVVGWARWWDVRGGTMCEVVGWARWWDGRGGTICEVIVSVSTRISTNIEDEATDDQLRRLGQIFEEADVGADGGLDIDAFRKAMRMTMGDRVKNEELDMLFMKVDTNCDGTVDWEEYLTFMLLECRERDMMTSLQLKPFPRRILLIPSEHRESIVRIALIPYAITSHVAAVRKNVKGRYVACGKDGTVSIWSMGMEHKSTRKCYDDYFTCADYVIQVMPASTMHTSVWVTDMACLPCFHTLVFATTARDIQFYDINVNRFDRLSRITGLQACPTALTFHESEYSIAKLIWGDQEGGISAITLQVSPVLTALNPKRAVGKRDRLPFSEILAEKIEFIEGYYMPGIHHDSVKQVMFSVHLNSVVSMSLSLRHQVTFSEHLNSVVSMSLSLFHQVMFSEHLNSVVSMSLSLCHQVMFSVHLNSVVSISLSTVSPGDVVRAHKLYRVHLSGHYVTM
ncbi:hypothetical protein NP493_732g02019 [Ridgeia piscesae]|uniref:EF-hand domain-containing protein n=1 Tax=Ridgeia piscesae TaxID=27915 RepID=A0AAD9KPQ7_RIDPI|nr:hypothetical protein NP493_732g02019 [Ridgeia piscesae]